jgi:hypothetical protein
VEEVRLVARGEVESEGIGMEIDDLFLHGICVQPNLNHGLRSLPLDFISSSSASPAL